jgi:thioredoxin-related protein
MGKNALEVFLHEYRITFPVGIDKTDENSNVPLTMQAYNLRGTPSLLIFDKSGQLKLSHFGVIDDMVVGALIGRLLA